MSENNGNFMCPYFMACNELCDVVSDDFLEASRVLDEYTTLVMRGDTPDKKQFTDRCPETQIADFEDLMRTVDFVYENHFRYEVSEETVNKAMLRIKELNEDKYSISKDSALKPGKRP